MPIFELGWAIPVKSHVWKFGSDRLSLSRVIVSTNIFPGGGGRNPLLGGLHLTCDAHFCTRMSNSSQKSCVKIWFGLVEIEGMLMFKGAEDPPIRGGYMWPGMPISEGGRALPAKSHVWKFGSDWLSISRVIVLTKKKKNHRCSWKQYASFMPIMIRVILKFLSYAVSTDGGLRSADVFQNLVTCSLHNLGPLLKVSSKSIHNFFELCC